MTPGPCVLEIASLLVEADLRAKAIIDRDDVIPLLEEDCVDPGRLNR